jgi:hypothetical protein
MKNNLLRFLSVAIFTGFALASCSKSTEVEVTDELGGSIGTRTLYADTVYVIDRFAYVDSGDVLTIQPGTIIKANTGSGPNASALIIGRGGKINAVGTPEMPIIFTSVEDDIQPGETMSTLSTDSKGLWGGVIILGYAPSSVGDGDTEGVIEGVPSIYTFSRYGGDDEEDNSGRMEFVSIRYTGSELITDQEIQGLTLGGVGSETILSNIEIISSDDDGVEFFGGTVSVSNFLIAYQSDDAVDLDQNYSGTMSNFLVFVNNAAAGNDANEHDGPENVTYTDGLYTLMNSTFINLAGNSRAGTLKSGAQGTIKDCAFIDFNEGFRIDGGSATTNYETGKLKVKDCQFNFSGTVRDFITASAKETEIKDLFEADGNEKLAKGDITKGADDSVFGWTFAKSLGLF